MLLAQNRRIDRVSHSATFDPRRTSRLWRIADAICQGPALQLMLACVKLDLNRPLIGWMLAQVLDTYSRGDPHGQEPQLDTTELCIRNADGR
jgi:hypothetical protein